MSTEANRELAAIAGALASPVRLRALNLLFQGPRSVEALAEALDESRANAAAHLKTLRGAGLVSAARDGKYALQQISHPVVLDLFMALRRAGEQLSPALRMLDGELEDDAPSPVGLNELEALTSTREVLLVDVRPEPEYVMGHLPHARSLPLGALEVGARELPGAARILVYCRGKYCPGARQGVAELRQRGRRAERLGFGVPEWRAAGRALEGGTSVAAQAGAAR